MGIARYCECERRVLTLFVEQTAYRMLLEHEQRAPFDPNFSKVRAITGNRTRAMGTLQLAVKSAKNPLIFERYHNPIRCHYAIIAIRNILILDYL